MNDKINNFVNALNGKSFLQGIKVPLLDGFKLVNNPNAIFTAVNDKYYMEQFLTDGIIKDDFETHINKVIEDTKNTMKESKLEDIDNSFKFIEDYKNQYFDFKIYTQDNKINGRMIRQFNVYFMDKDTNAFLQISVSSPPYATKDIEFVEGELTKNLTESIHNLLDKVKKETN